MHTTPAGQPPRATVPGGRAGGRRGAVPHGNPAYSGRVSSSAPAPGPGSRRRAATVLRTGLGTVLGLAAASLVAVLVPLHWAGETVVSREGFTRVVGTLADDRAFQEELARTAVDRAVDSFVGERSTGIAFLDRLVDEAARRAGDVAANLSADPSYQRAWTQALVRTHAANVPADGAVEQAPKDLVLDLTPLLGAVDGAVQRAVGVDTGLAGRQGVLTVPGTGTGRLVDHGARLAGMAEPLTWAAGALGVLALFVTRHRFATLAVMGLGSLAGLGVVWVLVERGVQRATGVLGADPLVRLVVDRVTLLLMGDLGERMVTAAWVAGAAGAVGVLGAVAVSAGSRRRRRTTA